MEIQSISSKKYLVILIGILVFFGLYLTSLYSYLLFHGLAEIFSIVIACGIFMIAWNSRRFIENQYLLFIGIAYLFIGAVDLIHTFAYTGMGVFIGYETDLPTQLWIAARYMESLSLLIAPLFLRKKVRVNIVFLGYSIVTALLFLSIFYWDFFPICFIESVGLTPFKKISEYIISLVLLGSIVLLLNNRKEFDRTVLQWVLWSIILTIASELAFTFYIHAYGFFNLVGHYLKIISFYLIYKALIETALTRPYSLLLRNLKQREEALAQLASFPEINPNPIIETDLTGQVDYANLSAKQIFADLQTTGPQHPWLERLEEVVQMLKDQQKVSIIRELKINDIWYGQSIHYVAKNQRLRIYGFDINERKQAEEALKVALQESRQHQAEISALLEGARAVLEYHEFKESARSIFDSCKNLIGASAGYVALLSKDSAENEVLFLDSGGLPCTVDPFLPMPIRGVREEAYRTGKTVFHNDFLDTEYVKLMPEGHVRLDHVLFAPLIIKGRVTGLLGLANKPGGFTESDARMASAFGELAAIALSNSQSLEALEHNEEHFRSVVQTAYDSIISIDSGGRIIYWNKAAEAMFGYSSDKMVGQRLTLIIPEIYRERHREAMHRVSGANQLERVEKIVEMSGLRRDGSELPLELSLAKWKTAEGIFFTGIIRDITQRKKMEEKVRRSRDELETRVRQRTLELAITHNELIEKSKILESFFKYTTTPLVFLDKNFNFIRVNNAYAKACQRDASEFPGHNHFEFYPHEENEAIFRQALKTKRPYQATAKPFSFPDHPEWGVTYWDWTLTPLIGDRGEVEFLVFSLTDVTDRKRSEEALKGSEEQLRHLSSRLLSAEENERKRIAREIHDSIGQSLTAIKFRVENMIQEMEGKKEKPSASPLGAIIPIIQQSIEESRRIQMDLRPSILDDLGILATLNWFCREFQNIFSRIDIKNQIDIQENDVPDALKTTIYRILQEAMNNIAKHSKADLVHLSLRKTGGNIELVIQDNGHGFNPNEALSIDPLRRGLGLTSMKERSELSGGTFSIQSIKGKGTTIRATWPI